MMNQQVQFIIRHNWTERMDSFPERMNYYLDVSGHTMKELQQAVDDYGKSLPYPVRTSYNAVAAHRAGRYQPNAARLAIYAAVTRLPEDWWAGYGTRQIRIYS